MLSKREIAYWWQVAQNVTHCDLQQQQLQLSPGCKQAGRAAGIGNKWCKETLCFFSQGEAGDWWQIVESAHIR